jgi:hypothetical protein
MRMRDPDVGSVRTNDLSNQIVVTRRARGEAAIRTTVR